MHCAGLSGVIVGGGGLVIMDRVISGLSGQMPVFRKPDKILLSVKADFHAGQKIPQKSLLLIDTIPKLLNIS